MWSWGERLLKHKSRRLSLSQAKAELMDHATRGAERLEEGPTKIDARTTEIIASHFTLEREMDAALERLVARPQELDRLGFGHKVQVLRAIVENPLMEGVAKQLIAFNELRNAAAHPRGRDLRPQVQNVRTLLEEYQEAFLADELTADDPLPADELAFLPPEHEATILMYAGAIAGGLQAVVSLEVITQAALSGRLKVPSAKKRKKARKSGSGK